MNREYFVAYNYKNSDGVFTIGSCILSHKVINDVESFRDFRLDLESRLGIDDIVIINFFEL